MLESYLFFFKVTYFDSDCPTRYSCAVAPKTTKQPLMTTTTASSTSNLALPTLAPQTLHDHVSKLFQASYDAISSHYVQFFQDNVYHAIPSMLTCQLRICQRQVKYEEHFCLIQNLTNWDSCLQGVENVPTFLIGKAGLCPTYVCRPTIPATTVSLSSKA